MADKNEITRTPDKVKGLENISKAVANALNFTLGREIEKDKQRKALEAVAQQQEFRKRLQQQDQEAAFARLQTDLAHKNVADERANELKQARLDELIRHHRAMEGTDAEKARSLALYHKALANKSRDDSEVEWLSKSLADRFNTLDALLDVQYTDSQNPVIKKRIGTVLREMQVYQNELDKYRATGVLPADVDEKIDATRYGTLTGLPPTSEELEKVANGTKSKTKPRLYDY